MIILSILTLFSNCGFILIIKNKYVLHLSYFSSNAWPLESVKVPDANPAHCHHALVYGCLTYAQKHMKVNKNRNAHIVKSPIVSIWVGHSQTPPTVFLGSPVFKLIRHNGTTSCFTLIDGSLSGAVTNHSWTCGSWVKPREITTCWSN